MLQNPWRGIFGNEKPRNRSIIVDESLLDFRGELRKIVDAKSLLNRSHFVHHFLKTVIAKELVFLLLKILAERIKLMRRNDFAKRGKKNGVLAPRADCTCE